MQKARNSQAFRPQWVVLVVAVVWPLAASGCRTMTPTGNGLLTGGGLGAATGSLFGFLFGHPIEGAALGAAIGATAGGATGAGVEVAERWQDQHMKMAAANAPVAGPPVIVEPTSATPALEPVPAEPPMSLQDVVKLTKSGSSDTVIINQIRLSRTAHRLTTKDILYLQSEGVREPVIRELQQSADRVTPRVYARSAVRTVVQPVYYTAPPFGWGWGR